MLTAWSSILSPEAWPTFVCITARLTGLFVVAPLWSMTALPRPARAAILVLLAIVLLPGSPRATLPEAVIELPVPLAMEMLLGLSIGLVAAVIVQGAAVAGDLMALQMGLQLGPALAPMPEFESSGIAQLNSLLATSVYVGVGGHLMLLRGIAESLQTLPPGTPLSLEGGGHAVVAMAGTLFSSALHTGAPVIVALLVTNAALAILSRAVPQLNTMMVSFPITIAVGLIIMGASLPIAASTFNGWMEHIPTQVSDITAAFQPLPQGH